MAAPEAVQDRTKALMVKAEETIKELEETVQSIPGKPQRGISPWLLGAAAGSIAIAITLYARKQKDDAVFVGLWAPTFLALGLFQDLLKLPKRSE